MLPFASGNFGRERIKALCPESAVLREPLVDLCKRLQLKGKPSFASNLLNCDGAAGNQHAKVLGDSLPTDRQTLPEVSGSQGTLTQFMQERASGWAGKSIENVRHKNMELKSSECVKGGRPGLRMG